MGKRKVMINLKDEKGSGLILALMVLLVLSVLGASLGVVTIGSLQLSDANRDSNSAYYIAEAGANMAYEKFKENVEKSYADPGNLTATQFFNNIQGVDTVYSEPDEDEANGFGTQFGDQPTATVSVLFPEGSGDKREYTIKSIGEVDRKKRTVVKEVSVKWIDPSPVGGSFGIPNNTVGIVKEELEIQGSKAEVEGYVYFQKNNLLRKNYTGKSWEEDPVLAGEEIINKIDFKQYEKEVKRLKKTVDDINNSDENSPNLKVGSELEHEGKKPLKLNLKQDAKIKKLKLLELDSGIHEINIGSNNIILAIEELDLEESRLNIVGDGTLTIIVSGEVKFDEAKFNATRKKVRIILTAEEEFEMKETEVHAQIIAPFGEVLIHVDSTVFGSVIAKELEIKNKGSLKAGLLDFNDSESKTDRGDFITSEPAIESD